MSNIVEEIVNYRKEVYFDRNILKGKKIPIRVSKLYKKKRRKKKFHRRMDKATILERRKV